MSAAVTWTMLDTPQGIAVAASVVAAAVAGGVIAMLRGYGRDPLERLAAVCAQLGLTYQATAADADATAGSVAGARVLARFVGPGSGSAANGEAGHGGRPVAVEVLGGGRSALPDAPARWTVCSVAAHAPVPAVTIQPRAWVLELDGRLVRPPVLTGNAGFDERWALLVAVGVDGVPDPAAVNAARAWWDDARIGAVMGMPEASGFVLVAGPVGVACIDPGVLRSREELETRLRLLEAVGLS